MIKLQVKIILWIFIIWARRLCGAQIESINSNELLAFEDFLRAQHLQHALLLGNCSGQIENYKRLFANYRLQFFTPQRGVQFRELFYHAAPRTALLVPALGDEQTKRWIYEPASAEGFFNNSQAWLLLGNSEANRSDDPIIRQHLSPYNINIDADITVAMRARGAANQSWLLYDVYRVSKQTPLMVQLKGHWSRADGYQVLASFGESWIRRRRNLHNITLIGSTALVEKPADMDDLSYLGNDRELLQLDPMQRKTYQLFLLIGRMYNMSLQVLFRDTWGQLLPNGSWSGVIGHIVSGEADFSVCPIRFVSERNHYIQYTPPLHTQLIHFLFRHPRRNSIRNIFFEPLSTEVWWCVLVLMVGSALLLVLHMRQERRLLQPAGQAMERPVSFVWFTILETYLQQGPAADQFRLPSTRLLISASCIFSFMLMQFYGAFIVGSLLSDTPRSIVNLQALYESDLEIGMEDIAYNFELFTNTTNRLVRDIYSQRICRARPPNILTIEEGAQRIRRGGFAFHTAIDRLYRLLNELLDERLFCELQEIMFNPPYLSASILAKSSPWREHLNHAILYLSETGLIAYNDRLWTMPRPDCTLFKDAQVEVDLKHFAPALFTLLLAMLVSASVFLLELLCGYLKARAKQQASQKVDKAMVLHP
ncbi:PREDICTED: glutamate receptor 1 [Drosophila arizonae]|uniref:Glutamate receptor 1 n=1 Tax=Drosophila arizonae TaxID=7263 RepID=A0ABM1NS26_DROAR|nr:PREDICTED: glutamate receptor 1 [Drosophila arizonae]